MKKVLLSFALAITSLCFAQLPDVAICGAPATTSWNTDVQTKLMATGQFNSVAVIDIGQTTPSLATLQLYDALLVYTDVGAINATQFGNDLALYIDQGGGVVCCTFTNASVPLGGNFNTATYQTLVPLGQTQGTMLTLGTVYLPNHPLMNGVTSFNGGSSSFMSTSTTITTNSYLVADWSNGAPLLIVNDQVGPMSVRRVDLNFYPPSGDSRSDFWDVNTDGGLIMANALTYVAGANLAPPTSASASPNTVCYADSVMLTAQNPIGTVYWYAGSCGTNLVGTGTSIWVNPLTTTTYYARNYSNSSFSPCVSVVVNVNQLPTVTLNLNPQIVCVFDPQYALTGGSPLGGVYSGPGVSGGNFNPATAGIGSFTIVYTYNDVNGCENNASQSITVSSCNSIEEFQEITLFELFPNPNNGEFHVSNLSGEIIKIEVYSVLGELMLKGFSLPGNSTSEFNLNDLSSGSYFVKASSENGIQLKRLIISR
jgi:hypothetical protein